MNKAVLGFILTTLILSIVACDVLDVKKTGEPVTAPKVPDSPVSGNSTSLQGETQAAELFTEEFSGDVLSRWVAGTTPKIDSESFDSAVLTSEDLSISSSDTFPTKNGIEFSFDLQPVESSFIYSGFIVRIVEKTFTSNEAKVDIRADGTAYFWIRGHCVPTPQVEQKAIPLDSNFHTFTFRAHTDGSSEWLLDGIVQMERAMFDTGGDDYAVFISGNTGANDSMYLDNIKVVSLGEEEPQYKICESKVVVVKNTCDPGYCLSNGICCSRAAPYYCNGACYATRDKAMSASQGRCSSWKIIC
jgi:hypothetical protein